MGDRFSEFIEWIGSNKLWGLVISLIVLFTLGLAYYYEVERTETHLFRRVEYPLIDLRHRMMARPDRVGEDIVVIGITEESIFRYSDELGRWPWPRQIMAYMFQYLSQADQVLVDIGYWEPSKTEITPSQALQMYQNMKAIRQRIVRAGRFPVNDYDRLMNRVLNFSENDDIKLARGTAAANVYHSLIFDFQMQVRPSKRSLREYRQLTSSYGYKISGREVFPRVPTGTIPIPPLLETSAGFGHINFIPDPDGPARRFAPFLGFRDPSDTPGYFKRPYLPMLGLAGILPDPASENIEVRGRTLYIGDEYQVPLDRDGNILIKYRGGSNIFKMIPIEDILKAPLEEKKTKYPPEWFKDKKVLIGATASGLFDLRSTPFTAIEPGVNIHANILDMFMKKDFLYPIRTRHVLIAAAVLTILTGLITGFSGPIIAFVLTALLSILYFVIGLGLFQHGYLINLSLPLICAGSSYVLATVYNLVFEKKKARQIRQAFEHYLTSSVMEEILKDPDKLQLGGERREITVMFGDIAGFTTFSEGRSATEVARVINEILTRLTRCVFDYQGVLDKYIGDALVAEFGIIPVEPGHHARRACYAAIDMRREIEKLHEEWEKSGTPLLDFRIGLHTGWAATGNMGSEILFDYTALGDTVNLGSRLEGANKVYGTKMMISEPTREQAGDKIVTRRLDSIIVKGKEEPIAVYELIGRQGEVADEKIELIKKYERAFNLYSRREFEKAHELFEDILSDHDDPPSCVFLKKTEELLDNPPPVDWQPVTKLTAK